MSLHPVRKYIVSEWVKSAAVTFITSETQGEADSLASIKATLGTLQRLRNDTSTYYTRIIDALDTIQGANDAQTAIHGARWALSMLNTDSRKIGMPSASSSAGPRLLFVPTLELRNAHFCLNLLDLLLHYFRVTPVTADYDGIMSGLKERFGYTGA